MTCVFINVGAVGLSGDVALGSGFFGSSMLVAMELDGQAEPANESFLSGFEALETPAMSSSASDTSAVANSSGSKAGELKTLVIGGVETNFRWAPAGTFLMGSSSSEKGRRSWDAQHEVTLSRGFWIAETETTQELWQAVMRHNPSTYTDSTQLPVETVSWKDCLRFVRSLNRIYGSALPRGYKYAMPTEAQWEYACRAGTTTPFNFGSTLNGEQANCNGERPYGTSAKGERSGKTKRVKSYAPNAWGLYDMHGNVEEWTCDWFDFEYYNSSSATNDPLGPDGGDRRVVRGGSYLSDAEERRSAYRSSINPDFQSDNRGFRLVLVAESQSQPSLDEEEVPTTSDVAVVEEAPTLQDEPQDLLESSPYKAGTLKTLEIAGVDVNFHWAPAGVFMMGSTDDEEGRYSWEDLHKVTLSQGFWVAETETTQELWQAVMGNNPSSDNKSNVFPVDRVSWDDCQTFVSRLNSLYGNALPRGYQYALPTEAQWEYACRAGTTTPFNFGSTLNGDKANCNGEHPYGTNVKGERLRSAKPVKSYSPNAWGLYDMHGNVEEWCADRFDVSYYRNSSAGKDPTGPENRSGRVFNDLAERVVRGGSRFSDAEDCRCAYRAHYKPDVRDIGRGFRLVVVRDSQPVSRPVEDVPARQDSSTAKDAQARQDSTMLRNTPGRQDFPRIQHSPTVNNTPSGDVSDSTREAGALKSLEIAGVHVNFHWAPAGTFQMGSPESEKGRLPGNWEKQHSVTFTRGFWVAETETTQELWQAVMSNNPSANQSVNQLPVENVSWDDCQEFVSQLNRNYSNVLPSGFKFALPTEAQWEYACRAGTTTPFNSGDYLFYSVANFVGYNSNGTSMLMDYNPQTKPVKSYKPNAWGLYDMHGNVWEWTFDWFDKDYYASASATKDPVGPATGSMRVLRGGSASLDAETCRSASRGCNGPSGRYSDIGFRLVLVR